MMSPSLLSLQSQPSVVGYGFDILAATNLVDVWLASQGDRTEM